MQYLSTMRKAGNAKIGTLLIIESLNGIATLCIEDSYKMLENGLPNAQLDMWKKSKENFAKRSENAFCRQISALAFSMIFYVQELVQWILCQGDFLVVGHSGNRHSYRCNF